MSVFLPLRRATLLVPSGPQSDVDRKHLFILLTNAHEGVARSGCSHEPLRLCVIAAIVKAGYSSAAGH